MRFIRPKIIGTLKMDLGYGGVVIKENPADWRTYIEVQLTNTLITDSCYHFEMFVNLADVSRYTSTNVGAYFSDTLISGLTNHLPLPVTPQISYSGSFIDTITWTSVSGDFIANGGENYLIIGNFLDDANSNFQTMDPVGQYICYFYIDEVSLKPCAPITGIEKIEKKTIKIFPNPVTNILNISVEEEGKKKIILFDATARLIALNEFDFSTSIDMTHFNEGIYFYQIIFENGEIYNGKFLKN
jgi:hypothetical protein